jgi:hypothetical protein
MGNVIDFLNVLVLEVEYSLFGALAKFEEDMGDLKVKLE